MADDMRRGGAPFETSEPAMGGGITNGHGASFVIGSCGVADGGAHREDDPHPERYVIGKPHPDRARQFKPFAALKGYYDMLEERE